VAGGDPLGYPRVLRADRGRAPTWRSPPAGRPCTRR
jgi:hypothetical protein